MPEGHSSDSAAFSSPFYPDAEQTLGKYSLCKGRAVNSGQPFKRLCWIQKSSLASQAPVSHPGSSAWNLDRDFWEKTAFFHVIPRVL